MRPENADRFETQMAGGVERSSSLARSAKVILSANHEAVGVHGHVAIAVTRCRNCRARVVVARAGDIANIVVCVLLAPATAYKR